MGSMRVPYGKWVLFGLHVDMLAGELFNDYSVINAAIRRAQRNGKKFGLGPTLQRDCLSTFQQLIRGIHDFDHGS